MRAEVDVLDVHLGMFGSLIAEIFQPRGLLFGRGRLNEVPATSIEVLGVDV